MGLDTWLGSGKKVPMGGKEFYVMPLPLGRLRDISNLLQEQVHAELTDLLKRQQQTPDAILFVADILKRIDATDVIFALLSDPINPDTKKPVNDISREFVDQYLDTPTLRKLVAAFIEVNELEELLKNLQGLPWIKEVWEALTLTFGISLSSFLRPNMDSVLDRPENSLSPKSMDTSEPTIGELKSDTEKESQPRTIQ